MQMLQEQPGFLGRLGLDNSIGTMHAPPLLAPPVNQPDPKEQQPQAEGAPGASNFQAHRLMFNNSVFNTYTYLHPEAASLLAAKGDISVEVSAKKSESTSTPKRSNIIYETQLMCKGRGFPLWIPQPNMRLPVSQRAKGVSIGDVGIITEYGAFDFLFNICISADDPVNPRDLPEGFTTLTLKAWDVREFRDFPNGSYLASPSVGKAVKGDDRRVTTFESSAEESALLSMPEGAYHEEVNDLSKFRDYAEKHVESWYDFVLHHRGRKDTANGDIRLVVGVDKSTSWGIASFSDPFKLQLKETEDPMMKKDCPYTWEHTGRSGEVKAGPDSCDNEDVCANGSGKIKNQTLFVRTLNILLVKDVWDEIQKPKEVVDRDDGLEFGVRCVSTGVAMSSPSLSTTAPRLLKRPAFPEQDDEFRPKKSRRLSLDETMVYLRRVLAQGFHDPESTGTLPGEHVPIYSEAEKVIKYKWMKLAYDCLPGIPSALRNTWKVPVQKAIKAESSPPELEGDIHPSSTASTIPAATTDEQKLLKMKKRIEEVSERVESLSYLPLTPWLAQGFRRGLYKASAGPSTPVQPDDEMDSDDALKILPGYRYGAPMRHLKPQPQMPVLEKEEEKRRNAIAGPFKQSRNRREKFQDLRAKAHEERMKSGSSSHVPPQDAVVRTQWSSEKEEICDGSLPDIDDSDLIGYEDERSSNEDPGWVRVNLTSQPNKHEVSPVATQAPTGLTRYSIVDSPSANLAKFQSASSKPPTNTVDSKWPRTPSVQELEARIKSLKRNQERRLAYPQHSKTKPQAHEDLLLMPPGMLMQSKVPPVGPVVLPRYQQKKANLRTLIPVYSNQFPPVLSSRWSAQPGDSFVVSHDAGILDGEDEQPSPESSSVATVSRSPEGPVDGGSPMNCDTDDRLSTVTAPGVNDGADGSNVSRYETLPETGHEADIDLPSQHSSKTDLLPLNMLGHLQPPAKPVPHNPAVEGIDYLLDRVQRGQSMRIVHSGYGPDQSLTRTEVTSERPNDATRLGPRPKIQFDARRDLDAGAPSSWRLSEDTPFKHPSLAINSWILGAARLPSSVKMVITHDSAWYGILDDQSLRRACQVRLAIENHELEETDSDVIQSLYGICVTPGRTAMYLEPKDKCDNVDNVGVASQLDLTIAAMRADGRAVFEYLLGSYGLLQSSSANFDFSHRQLQISDLHGKLLANQGLAAPSTTFDSLQLLDYHPARHVTVEVLLQVLHGEMTAKEACDSNSVGELRKALQTACDDDNSTQRILRKLANALLNRALEFTDKDSVEDAIFYYQYLESSTVTETIEYLELLLGLCTAHYLRYQLLRMREDIDSLIKYLDTQTSLNFVVLLDHYIARCAGMISL